MVERRLSKRMPFESHIIYGTTDQFSGGSTSDLSEEGIGITTNKLLPIGSQIAAKVVVEDKTEEFSGRIIWTSETMPGTTPRMGVKFISPSEKLLHLYADKTEKDR